MTIATHDMPIEVHGRLVRIARLQGEKYTFPDDPPAFLTELRKRGTRIDLFTFLQRLPETSPQYPYVMERDNLAVLPITSFDYWWNNQIRSYPRNRARQAAKRGVVMREVPYGDDLINGICAIYNETPVRQGKKFPHYGMTPARARAYAATFLDRSVYIGAYCGDEMIGFLKLTMDQTRTQAALVHLLSKVSHKDKAPTNALIAEAVRVCEREGVRFLIYEHFAYGGKVADSLSHFKQVNGFERVDVPRYYVPLSALGRVALRFGAHHPLSARIPETIAGRLRDLRRAWYSHRFPTTEAQL